MNDCSGNWAGLYSFDVFSGSELVARGKPATASSFRGKGSEPGNAVDASDGPHLADFVEGSYMIKRGGTLRLPAGQQRFLLQAHAPDKTNSFNASVFSVELVRPHVREQLHAAALKLRADTRWLQDCRYGLMCHWTSQTFSRRGERKPYTQAVQDFDVEGFARQVQETGAGFVVFTTSHAQHFFPAPLEVRKNDPCYGCPLLFLR